MSAKQSLMARRHFLITSAWVGAGGLIIPSIAHAETTPSLSDVQTISLAPTTAPSAAAISSTALLGTAPAPAAALAIPADAAVLAVTIDAHLAPAGSSAAPPTTGRISVSLLLDGPDGPQRLVGPAVDANGGMGRVEFPLSAVVAGTSVSAATLRLEDLNDEDARAMVERLARRNEVNVNDQTRDLIVQQTSGNPLYITSLLRAAREQQVALTSYRNCQQLYVDELLGGRIGRHFASILEDVTPSLAARRSLVRVLYESSQNDGGRAPVDVWRKRLNLEPELLLGQRNQPGGFGDRPLLPSAAIEPELGSPPAIGHILP